MLDTDYEVLEYPVIEKGKDYFQIPGSAKTVTKDLRHLGYSQSKKIFKQRFDCDFCLIKEDFENEIYDFLLKKIDTLNDDISELNKKLENTYNEIFLKK